MKLILSCLLLLAFVQIISCEEDGFNNNKFVDCLNGIETKCDKDCKNTIKTKCGQKSEAYNNSYCTYVLDNEQQYSQQVDELWSNDYQYNLKVCLRKCFDALEDNFDYQSYYSDVVECIPTTIFGAQLGFVSMVFLAVVALIL